MRKETAILVFANSAEKEAEHKGFLSKKALLALNTHTLNSVKQTQLDYFHFSEKNQVGTTFAQRFNNAIAQVFKQGYKHIITIGNDTPHLKTTHLLNAVTALKTNDIVIGPSKDGGFYLMGISKTHYKENLFLNLPWQTQHLQDKIKALATTKNLQISCLEVLTDIDAKADIITVLNSFKSLTKSISQALNSIIFTVTKPPTLVVNFITNYYTSKLFNKGSPSFL